MKFYETCWIKNSLGLLLKDQIRAIHLKNNERYFVEEFEVLRDDGFGYIFIKSGTGDGACIRGISMDNVDHVAICGDVQLIEPKPEQ